MNKPSSAAYGRVVDFPLKTDTALADPKRTYEKPWLQSSRAALAPSFPTPSYVASPYAAVGTGITSGEDPNGLSFAGPVPTPPQRLAPLPRSIKSAHTTSKITQMEGKAAHARAKSAFNPLQAW